jgi:hypothetical protein
MLNPTYPNVKITTNSVSHLRGLETEYRRVIINHTEVPIMMEKII